MSEHMLAAKLAALPSTNREWHAPTSYDLSESEDRQALDNLIDNGEIATVTDPVEAIADSLYEMRNPAATADVAKRAQFHEEVKEQGEAFGTWHYFPWSKELVRYPDQDDHRDLRTFRNRNLITDDEQAQMYDSRMAVFGLSVGSSVVERLVSSGIGGTLAIGDMDTMDPTNLNRINGVFGDVGTRKLDRMARFISQVDPYIHQEHFADGINESELARLQAFDPDIIFEEVDNIGVKARLRLFAREIGVPLVMASDVGDKSILDVERYDLPDTPQPFNGMIKPEEVEKLAEGTADQKASLAAAVKIIGMKNVTTRLLGSVLEGGKTLGGLPQLGNTATVGGALAATAAREIVLGRNLPSGRYVYSPKAIMKLDRQATFGQAMRTIKAFKQSQKASKNQ